jgi:hypothetical protein
MKLMHVGKAVSVHNIFLRILHPNFLSDLNFVRISSAQIICMNLKLNINAQKRIIA